MKKKFYVNYEKDDGAEMRKHAIFSNNSNKAQAIGWLSINEKTGSFMIVAEKGKILIEVINKSTERRHV